MVSLPPSGNGHKPFSTNHAQSPKERHQLSLTELAFGRNLGNAASRMKRLERQMLELCENMDRAVDDLLDLLHTGRPGEMTSWTSWVQERIQAQAYCITPFFSSLRKEEKDKRPSSRVSPKTRARVRLVDVDLSPGFQRFWSVWPKRVAKQDALKAWTELNPSSELQDQILEAVKLQIENNFAGDNQRRIPYPATWLRAERWTDEILEPELTREQQLDRAYRRLCEEESADAQS